MNILNFFVVDIGVNEMGHLFSGSPGLICMRFGRIGNFVVKLRGDENGIQSEN